jgi:hypothetical protein
MSSLDNFRSTPPPRITSKEYAEAFNPDISQVFFKKLCNILKDNNLFEYYKLKKDYRVFFAGCILAIPIFA